MDQAERGGEGSGGKGCESSPVMVVFILALEERERLRRHVRPSVAAFFLRVILLARGAPDSHLQQRLLSAAVGPSVGPRLRGGGDEQRAKRISRIHARADSFLCLPLRRMTEMRRESGLRCDYSHSPPPSLATTLHLSARSPVWIFW